MAHYRIEFKMKNATQVSKRQFPDEREAMAAWDDLMDDMLGGDTARLINMNTGTVVSEYNPVERSYV